MIIGTAGHIDHGKTALVRALTGVDTDRLPEEKRRGITIELGYAPLTVPRLGVVSIIDVPGHEAFVRTMLAGATSVDLALIVIAADEGVMPQTREHVDILNLLGVQKAIIALTKCDIAEPDFADLVAHDAVALLQGTAMEGAPVFRVSAVRGEGIDALRDGLASNARAAAERTTNDLARMPIDRVFTIHGTGTVVTGTLWSGMLRVGDDVRVLPSGRRARVRGLQMHGAQVSELPAGTRVAVSLGGVDHDDIQRGDTLVNADAWMPSTVVRADVALLRGMPPLSSRTRVRIHLATQDVGGRVLSAGGPVVSGETRSARIVLDAPLIARGGDRFVIRRASPPATIGGGVITDAIPASRRVRPFASPGLSESARVAAIVDAAAFGGVNIDALPVRIGVSPHDIANTIDAPSLVRVGNLIVARATIDTAMNAIVRWLDAFHRTNSRESGAPLEAARVVCRGDAAIVSHVLDSLVAANTVVIDGARIRRATWTVVRDGAADARRVAILARLVAAGAAVPSVKELERDFGAGVIPLLRQLEREGQVIALSADRFASAAFERELTTRLAAELAPDRGYTASELKTTVGVSRQFLIPWLEYFDRRGISRREGDLRLFQRKV